MVKVYWRGTYDATVITENGRIFVTPGDIFEMGREEAEARTDVEIVSQSLVIASPKPKGKTQSEDN